MPSLFAQYSAERTDKLIIEDENGFATYHYQGNVCYIEDVYVIPEKRKKRIASGYVKVIAETAKIKDIDTLMTSVNLLAKNSTDSLKAVLGAGFSLHSANSNMIFLTKDING